MTEEGKILSRCLLIMVFIGSIASSVTLAYRDSPTSDEPPHLAAGYTYLKFNDYRLNPEHPPLLKILAAFPLMTIRTNLRPQAAVWQERDQWALGGDLIYHSGNNPDWLMFLARLPIVFIYIIFGIIFFFATRKFYGEQIALLATILLLLSPTITAHNHLVTTDLGVTAFIFFSLYTYTLFLIRPSWFRITVTGIILGLTLITKFSALILLPVIILGTIVYLLFNRLQVIKFYKKYLAGFLIIVAFCLLIIGAAYYHPGTSYFNGIKSVSGRLTNGSVTFLLGKITDQSFWWYFPILLFTKETVGFFILVLSGVIYYLGKIRNFSKTLFIDWLKKPFDLFMVIFVFAYSFVALTSNLNIGFRHLMPILPPLYIFTAKLTVDWLNDRPSKIKNLAVISIFIWIILAYVLAYPAYLSYFNELVGGTKNGYRVAVDSNLDWGQDLKRLNDFLQKNDVKKIKLDYFGGGDPKYYLKDKYDRWSVNDGQTFGWIAISATYFQNSRWFSLNRGEKDYDWLRYRKPDANINGSILVYKID